MSIKVWFIFYTHKIGKVSKLHGSRSLKVNQTLNWDTYISVKIQIMRKFYL